MAARYEYLGLEDYLLLAEALLDQPAEQLARLPRIGGAESALLAPQAVIYGEEQYPEFATKAAVLCVRLIKNHPLPDANKRVGFLCLVEFVERNGYRLEFDEDEAFEQIMGVAAGQASEEEFAAWVAACLR